MSELHKEIQEELAKIAPSLGRIDKHEYSDLPEGYFKQLPETVWNKIKEDEVTQVGQRPKIFNFVNYRVLTIAASLLLIFAVLFVIRTSSTVTEEFLTEDQLLSYFIEYPDKLDDELMYSLLSEADITGISFTADDELLDYYIEKNIQKVDDDFLDDIF